MRTENQRFENPAAARAYISKLANRFEDSEQMLVFLNSCEMAQASLVYMLFQEYRSELIQETQFTRGVYTEMESQVERESVWNECKEASAEYQLAIENVKKIISKLNMSPVD